jgi:hypothetical protein
MTVGRSRITRLLPTGVALLPEHSKWPRPTTRTSGDDPIEGKTPGVRALSKSR